MRSEGTRAWSQHLRPGDVDVDADGCERWEVGRLEGVEVFGREFDGAVASEELVVEEEANFGDVVVPGDNQRSLQPDEFSRSLRSGKGERTNEDVVDGVCEELGKGDLGAREDDRLAARKGRQEVVRE